MKRDIRKILVCSSTLVTGGPELLHQLVHSLRGHGHDAMMVYLPLDRPSECPEPYRIYDAPQSRLIDAPDVLLILPEVETGLARKIRHCQVAIWWLSVDNYLCAKRESLIRDYAARCRSLLRQQLPLFALRKYRHFAQSEYAMDFLRGAGIRSERLSDYINLGHLEHGFNGARERRNIIVYNPKKGTRHTNAVRRLNPDLEFVPIENMKLHEVAELLSQSKLYIDFGHHPGKDRLPREAAVAGCCVITGRRGAAGNSVDVPIPEDFKLDERNRRFRQLFRERVASVFSDFERQSRRFDAYRAGVQRERIEFERQVREIFG